MATGKHFSLFISRKGKLKYFAQNSALRNEVKLNSIPIQKQIIEIACSSRSFVALTTQGTVWHGTFASDLFTFQCIKFLGEINSVAAGGKEFFVFLTNNKTLYGLGDNSEYPLGPQVEKRLEKPFPISGISNIFMVRCGLNFTLALDEFGCVYGSGGSNLGGSYHAPFTSSFVKILDRCNIVSISCSLKSAVCLLDDGSVYGSELAGGCLAGNGFQFKKIPNLCDIVSVESNSSCFYFLDKNCAIWGMGLNNSGELGLGDNRRRHVPCKIGESDFSVPVYVSRGFGERCFIQELDGKIWSFGANSNCECGEKYCSKILSPLLLPESISSKILGKKRSSAKSARK